MKKIIYIAISLVILQSCQKEDDVVCPSIGEAIFLKVVGDPLTNFYTLRNSNLDTLRIDYPAYELPSGQISYPVISNGDKFTSEIERFNFIGEINGQIVIDEEYIIKSVKCDFEKISGKEEIEL